MAKRTKSKYPRLFEEKAKDLGNLEEIIREIKESKVKKVKAKKRYPPEYLFDTVKLPHWNKTLKLYKDSDIPKDFKKCNACQEVLPLEYFNNQKGTKDGKTTRCSKCRMILKQRLDKPSKFHLSQLPVTIRNNELMNRLKDNILYDIYFKNGFKAILDLTINKYFVLFYDGKILFSLEFKNRSREEITKWLIGYFLTNQLWICVIKSNH